jgi:hypothetical protein
MTVAGQWGWCTIATPNRSPNAEGGGLAQPSSTGINPCSLRAWGCKSVRPGHFASEWPLKQNSTFVMKRILSKLFKN